MRFYIFIPLENIVPKVGLLISMSIARSACPGNPWNAQPPHGVITEITSQVRRKHMVGDIYGISMVYLWYIYGVCRNCSILKQCQEFKHAQNISKRAISCNCKLLQRKVGRKDFFAQLLTCDDLIRNDELGGFCICWNWNFKIFTLALSAQFNEEPANEVGNMAAGHQGEAVMNFHTSRVKNSPRAQPK